MRSIKTLSNSKKYRGITVTEMNDISGQSQSILPETCFKNVLITGGCGFICSNFVNYLVKKYPQCLFVNIDCLYYCSSRKNIIVENYSNYVFVQDSICRSPGYPMQLRRPSVRPALQINGRLCSCSDLVDFEIKQVSSSTVDMHDTRRRDARRA